MRDEGLPLTYRTHATTDGPAVVVHCPICRDEFIHVDGVVEVTADADYGCARFFGADVHGSLTALRFRSDCGSAFVVVFGFHEGMTFVHTWVEVPCDSA